MSVRYLGVPLPIIDSFLFHQHADGFLNITMAGLGLEQLNVQEC
jgi:hypothetical protein